MSHEYWFKVLDQDGDGIISIYDLHQFYIEQLIKLKSINIDPISFEDKLDDILDRLAAATNTDPTTLAKGIRLATLKAAKEVAQPILGTWVLIIDFIFRTESLIGIFKTFLVDTFINVEKYIQSDMDAQELSPGEVDTPWQERIQKNARYAQDTPDFKIFTITVNFTPFESKFSKNMNFHTTFHKNGSERKLLLNFNLDRINLL